MKLSIIIPIYNEIAQLNKTIKKLMSLKKKLKFELIFIDDFSNDGSFAYIKKIKKRFNFIKIFKNKKKVWVRPLKLELKIPKMNMYAYS